MLYNQCEEEIPTEVTEKFIFKKKIKKKNQSYVIGLKY